MKRKTVEEKTREELIEQIRRMQDFAAVRASEQAARTEPKLGAIPTNQFLTQARNAEIAQANYLNDLYHEGWVWDPILRHYTHPERPGHTIAIG